MLNFDSERSNTIALLRQARIRVENGTPVDLVDTTWVNEAM